MCRRCAVATRSPTLKSRTRGPTSTTSPATSWPGMKGSSTPRFIVPLRVTTSWKHTPQVSTLMRTSFGLSSASGTSSSCKTSDAPVSRTTIALMEFSFVFCSVSGASTRRAELEQRDVLRHIIEHGLHGRPDRYGPGIFDAHEVRIDARTAVEFDDDDVVGNLVAEALEIDLVEGTTRPDAPATGKLRPFAFLAAAIGAVAAGLETHMVTSLAARQHHLVGLQSFPVRPIVLVDHRQRLFVVAHRGSLP